MIALNYLWYGDDFTGASDTLSTFASAGFRALLCLGVPSAERLKSLGGLDALGIAGAARTMSPQQMMAELEPVGRFAAEARVPLLHYKCCSTFDSAPSIGSLGAAMNILRRHVRNPFVPVVGGQPSLERYCAFGNLYAAAGAGAEIFRLDRHPTMSRHPSTPMHEADLRLHLREQGLEDIALIDWRKLGGRTADELDSMIGEGGTVLFDVLDEPHLARIGELIWRRAMSEPLLALGASSVAQAVIAQWRKAGLAPPHGGDISAPPASAPVLMLVGSQSPVSAEQAAFAQRIDGLYQAIRIDPSRRTGEALDFAEEADVCARHLLEGRSVLAYLAPVNANGPSRLQVAQACGRLLKRVLARTPALRRIGIAGGDTSSLSVEALGIWALGFAGALAPGVGLARAHSDDPKLDGLELMLKGGQMGPPDTFVRLLRGMPRV
jgi:uncharacterized protein YgbK (DUF1537 family)